MRIRYTGIYRLTLAMRMRVLLRLYTHEVCKCRAALHPVLDVRIKSNISCFNPSSHSTQLSQLMRVEKTPSVMEENRFDFNNRFPFAIGKNSSNSHPHKMVAPSHIGHYIDAGGYCVFGYLDRCRQNSDKP